MKKTLSDFPDLIKEWDYSKNKIDPAITSIFSEEKVWWKCKNGHEYLNRIDTKARGVSCPVCDGRKIVKGINDIFTLYPVVKKYWNFEKNLNCDIEKIRKSSSTSYWWICPKCKYEWHTRISHITDKNFKGCNKCYLNDKKNSIKIKDTVYSSNLIKEWDYNKNELDPKKTSKKSSLYAWWICSQGHSYKSRIDSRNRGTNCPICSGHKVLKGYNDIATIKPKILEEWDYSKNNITPYEVHSGSAKMLHLICEKKHKYQMQARDYVNGYNCPICSHRLIVPGINDLASYDKRIILEWNYEKNKIDPTTLSPLSTKKVWWIGECGHEWKSSIYSRVKMGTNCPVCAEERHASVSEKTVLYYLKKSNQFIEILENYKDDKIKLELDIYIPEKKIAIEYDGERWHRNIEKDLKKDIMCEKLKILLIRIRENGCPYYDSQSKKILMKNNKNDGLSNAIKELLKILNIQNVKINIDADTSEILKMINFMIKEQSIKMLYPEISKEWHPTKNGNLKPEHTKPGSNKKVWWLCSKGHEYQLRVNYRTLRGNGCPICSGHQVLKGYNDLETLNKEVSDEWHPTKNGNLKASDVTVSSSKKVWWLCSKGHEWQTTISHRKSGSKCPICSGHQVLKGYNDLETLNPDLIKEWDFVENKDIQPDNISLHSGKKVWWICSKCGNKWQATVDKRSNGRGCPKCHFSIIRSNMQI